MCGIVGYVGFRSAKEVVISGLEKLEYRGYDSAGLAIISNSQSKNSIKIFKAAGRLQALKDVLAVNDSDELKKSTLGIGHTRWATHGAPLERNAHPHSAGPVSLVHNGIIENYLELKSDLIKEGVQFSSDTDSEVIAHLLSKILLSQKTPDLFIALKDVCQKIRGSYSIVAISNLTPDTMVVAKTATPLIIGLGKDEMFVASDIPGVLSYTREVIPLEEGDVAELKACSIKIETLSDKKIYTAVTRNPKTITWDPITAQKGGFKHYMLKEVFDQSVAVGDCIRGKIDSNGEKITFPELELINERLNSINRVVIAACGTAMHAGLIAKFYIEEFSGIPCEVDYASEFRYRANTLSENTLFIAISQSGETADTLAAAELASKTATCVAICNVVGSSLTRKIPATIFTNAGPEISVASTKAFTTQVVAAFLLALYLGQEKGKVNSKFIAERVKEVLHLPILIDEVLQKISAIEDIAKKFYKARDFLFLGRGILYPVALEGALKLKEISYIHAEGYPAGEIKHGPLALVDEEMPVVMALSKSHILEKSISNMKEVEARGGKLIVITDTQLPDEILKEVQCVFEVPNIGEYLAPVLVTLPMQLLSYYVAVLNGTDVDLPRNLAKSVTVE